MDTLLVHHPAFHNSGHKMLRANSGSPPSGLLKTRYSPQHPHVLDSPSYAVWICGRVQMAQIYVASLQGMCHLLLELSSTLLWWPWQKILWLGDWRPKEQPHPYFILQGCQIREQPTQWQWASSRLKELYNKSKTNWKTNFVTTRFAKYHINSPLVEV